MTQRKRIGLLVFDGITALDLVGPAEAFAERLGYQTETAFRRWSARAVASAD